MSENNFRQYAWKKIIRYIFESATIAFFLFFAAEYFKRGIVTNYFYFNALLTLCLVSGIMVVVFGERQEKLGLGMVSRIFHHIVILFVSAVSGYLIFLSVTDALLILKALPFIGGLSVYFLLLKVFGDD